MISIKELCEQILTSAIEKLGWDRELQISFCEDEDFVYSQFNTEYVLFYKPNIPVAVISVTGNDTEIDSGIEQAIENAEELDIPCAFSSNGNGFLFYDRTKPPKYAETELDLENFPTPEELWEIYLNYKNAKIATNETIKAVKNGQNRLLLGVAAVGVGLVATVFQIIKGLFETNTNKRALYLTDRDDYWKNKDWDYWRDRSDWKNRTNRNLQNQLQNNNYQNYTPLNQIPINNPAGIYCASIRNLATQDKTQNYKQFPPDFFDVIIVDKNHNGNITDSKKWQESLEYFKSATQISVTPQEKVLANHNGNIADSKEWQKPLEYFKSATQIAITPQEKVTASDVGYFGTPICIDISKQIFDSSFPVHNLSSKESQINHITNNSYIENNANISTNNSTTVNNSITNNYTDNGDTVINKTENNHTQINHNTITINSTVMARQTSFSHQIELAEDLKKYLHGFQERLGDVAQNYKNKCNDLFEAGMMDETFKDFEQNYMQETIQKIANVVEQINERDIPFIEKYIDYLEQNPSR